MTRLNDAIARNRARHAEKAARLAALRERFSGPEWEPVCSNGIGCDCARPDADAVTHRDGSEHIEQLSSHRPR